MLSEISHEGVQARVGKQLVKELCCRRHQVGDNRLEFQVSSHPVTTSINITEYLLQKVYCPRPIMYTKTEN